MTTKKYMMHIKNIMNNNISEEEKMFINEMKTNFEKDEDLPKNLKIFLLSYIQDVLNGNENFVENFMNIQFDENDIKFLKGMHKEIQETKIFPFFDKIDSDDYYDFLLDMKNETLRKRLEEKYRDVEFF